MLLRVGVPLLILVVLALIFLAWVFIYKRRREEFLEEERLAQRLDGDGLCHDLDPKSGYICQDDLYHFGKHHQIVNDEKHTWP